MELFNATGETLSQKYDNQEYVFPPNEVIMVTDDCGKHCLLHQGRRGLQQIRYGDDPIQLSVVALNAIVAYHELQLEAHNNQARVAGESKNPIPAEPDGYKIAKRRLPAYLTVLKEREADAEVAAAKDEERKIREALDKKPDEIKPIEDMNVDEQRDVIRSLGGEPNMRHGQQNLIKQIKALRKQADGDG